MKKLILGCLFTFFLSEQNFAQKSLLFLNTKTNKSIEICEGQTISVQYRGYNTQIYHIKNIVNEINDSNILIGNISMEQPVWVQKLRGKFEPDFRIIAIKDIVAFRRITVGRTLAKSLVSSSMALVTIYGMYSLISKQNLSYAPTIFISLGISLISTTLNAIILPENPRYKVNEGWIITVRN
jgi:hypothetical protein